MNRQLTLSAISDELAQAKTKKKEFLAQIERIVPWGKWLSLIEPHYYNSVRSQAQIKRREREKSSVRAKVEHAFGVFKGPFHFRKTRYQGLRKQTAKLNMMFALANLWLADRPCLAV